jgi:hypothetical protein
MMMKKTSMWTIGAAFAAVSVWACSSDPPEGSGSKSCPQENPECKEIAEASAGELAVDRRRCVTCHNSDKGTMAGATTALAQQDPGVELYPPNLTNDEETGVGTWTDDNLANAIRTGLDKEGLNLCPQMKHFADMSDYEAYSIVKYLRALPPVKNKVPRSICPPLKTREE